MRFEQGEEGLRWYMDGICTGYHGNLTTLDFGYFELERIRKFRKGNKYLGSQLLSPSSVGNILYQAAPNKNKKLDANIELGSALHNFVQAYHDSRNEDLDKDVRKILDDPNNPKSQKIKAQSDGKSVIYVHQEEDEIPQEKPFQVALTENIANIKKYFPEFMPKFYSLAQRYHQFHSSRAESIIPDDLFVNHLTRLEKIVVIHITPGRSDKVPTQGYSSRGVEYPYILNPPDHLPFKEIREQIKFDQVLYRGWNFDPDIDVIDLKLKVGSPRQNDLLQLNTQMLGLLPHYLLADPNSDQIPRPGLKLYDFTTGDLTQAFMDDPASSLLHTVESTLWAEQYRKLSGRKIDDPPKLIGNPKHPMLVKLNGKTYSADDCLEIARTARNVACSTLRIRRVSSLPQTPRFPQLPIGTIDQIITSCQDFAQDYLIKKQAEERSKEIRFGHQQLGFDPEDTLFGTKDKDEITADFIWSGKL